MLGLTETGAFGSSTFAALTDAAGGTAAVGSGGGAAGAAGAAGAGRVAGAASLTLLSSWSLFTETVSFLGLGNLNWVGGDLSTKEDSLCRCHRWSTI